MVHSEDGFEAQQLTVDLDQPAPGHGFGIQSHMPGLVEGFVVECDLGERAARQHSSSVSYISEICIESMMPQRNALLDAMRRLPDQLPEGRPLHQGE